MDNTYYIKTAANGGNDGNGGLTAGDPILTLQEGVNRLGVGDRIWMYDGSFFGRVLTPEAATQGTAGSPIVIEAAPGQTPVLTASTTAASTAMIWLGGASGLFGTRYFTIRGLTLDTYSAAGLVFLGQSENVDVLNNKFRNQTFVAAGEAHAVVFSTLRWTTDFNTTRDYNFESTNIVIDGNDFTDIDTGVPSPSFAFDEVCTLGWAVKGFRMTNNTLRRCQHQGLDLIGKSAGQLQGSNVITVVGDKFPQFGVISGNTCIDVGTQGADVVVYLDGAKDVIVEDNFVYQTASRTFNSIAFLQSTEDTSGNFITERIIVRRNRAANIWRGIMGGSASNLSPSDDIRIAHNTVSTQVPWAAIGTNLMIGAVRDENSSKWMNNISHEAAVGTGAHYAVAPSFGGTYDQFMDHTGYWQDAPGEVFYIADGLHSTFAAYQLDAQNFLGAGQEANSFLADPLFVDAPNFDFNLDTGSPYINAGGALATTTSAGSGTTVQVTDSLWFSDGYGQQTGDSIRIGTGSPVTVTAVNHSTNTLTISASQTWASGEAVNYNHAGTAPDLGAFQTGELPASGGLVLITASDSLGIGQQTTGTAIGPTVETILQLNIGTENIFKTQRTQLIFWKHDPALDTSSTPIPLVTITVSSDNEMTTEMTLLNVPNVVGWNSQLIWLQVASTQYRIRITDPARAEVFTRGAGVFTSAEVVDVTGVV